MRSFSKVIYCLALLQWGLMMVSAKHHKKISVPIEITSSNVTMPETILGEHESCEKWFFVTGLTHQPLQGLQVGVPGIVSISVDPSILRGIHIEQNFTADYTYDNDILLSSSAGSSNDSVVNTQQYSGSDSESSYVGEHSTSGSHHIVYTSSVGSHLGPTKMTNPVLAKVRVSGDSKELLELVQVRGSLSSSHNGRLGLEVNLAKPSKHALPISGFLSTSIELGARGLLESLKVDSFDSTVFVDNGVIAEIPKNSNELPELKISVSGSAQVSVGLSNPVTNNNFAFRSLSLSTEEISILSFSEDNSASVTVTEYMKVSAQGASSVSSQLNALNVTKLRTDISDSAFFTLYTNSFVSKYFDAKIVDDGNLVMKAPGECTTDYTALKFSLSTTGANPLVMMNDLVSVNTTVDIIEGKPKKDRLGKVFESIFVDMETTNFVKVKGTCEMQQCIMVYPGEPPLFVEQKSKSKDSNGGEVMQVLPLLGLLPVQIPEPQSLSSVERTPHYVIINNYAENESTSSTRDFTVFQSMEVGGLAFAAVCASIILAFASFKFQQHRNFRRQYQVLA